MASLYPAPGAVREAFGQRRLLAGHVADLLAGAALQPPLVTERSAAPPPARRPVDRRASLERPAPHAWPAATGPELPERPLRLLAEFSPARGRKR